MNQVLHPLVRATAIISAVTVIVTTSTFAMLDSQALLTGNTISSASVNLQVSTDNVIYGSSADNFVFPGLISGGSAVPDPGHSLWVRNTGSQSIGLRVGVVPTPDATVVPSGSVDFSKVILIFQRAGAVSTVEHSLQELIDAHPSDGITLNESIVEGGDPVQFTLQIKTLSGAFAGSSATISDLDLEFFGLSAVE